MNGLYMAECTAALLLGEVVPVWKERGWVEQNRDRNDPYCTRVIDLLKVRSKKVSELIDNAAYFFRDPEFYEEKTAKKLFTPETASAFVDLTGKIESLLVVDAAALEALYHDYAEENRITAGILIHPTRLAISGVSFGPGLFELMALLGKETVIRRLKRQRRLPFIGSIKGIITLYRLVYTRQGMQFMTQDNSNLKVPVRNHPPTSSATPS